MQNDGSTSAELEDPSTATAEPESIDQEREAPAEVADEPAPQTETTGDEPADASAPDAKPVVPAGKPAKAPGAQPERPDPVKAAIERLSSDGPKSAGTAKPPAKPAGQPAPAAKDPATQPDQRAQPEDPALAWMSPEQRRHTKGSVKEHIRKQHTELTAARATMASSKEAAEIGEGWGKLIESEGLQWEATNLSEAHFAQGIRSRGALARAYHYIQQGYAPREEDIKVLDQQRQALDAIDRSLGRSSTGEAVLHQGEIPADLTGLGELGLSERELRLIAADRARQSGRAKPAAPALAAPPQPQARSPQQPVAQQAQPRQAPTAPAAPRPDANQQLYTQLTAQDIQRRFKVAPDQVNAFYTRNLVPHVTSVLAEWYPTQQPQESFAAISPQARRDLVAEAMTRFEAQARSTQPATRRPQDSPLRTRGGPQTAAPADPVQGAIQRLRSD